VRPRGRGDRAQATPAVRSRSTRSSVGSHLLTTTTSSAVARRLLYLFGDQDRLAAIVAASHGALPPRAIQAVQLHTRAQFVTTTEKAHKHVDADRLVALGRPPPRRGTPMQTHTRSMPRTCPSCSSCAAWRAGLGEGAARRVRAHRGRRGPAARADGARGDRRRARPQGTITLAGDHRQATDESAWFTGWEAARAELRRRAGSRPRSRSRIARCRRSATSGARSPRAPHRSPPSHPRIPRCGRVRAGRRSRRRRRCAGISTR